MKKAELRSLYLERRRTLSATALQEDSRRISERFFSSFDLSSIRYLHSYIPIAKSNEIDTLPILEQVWTGFPRITTLAPKFDFESGELISIEQRRDTVLLQNKWSIPEPEANDPIGPEMIDLVVVPLLCFDSAGHRIGYGKGIYDSFLRYCRADCKKVGLNLFEPVDSIDDVGEHDIALDHCVTPNELFTFADTSA